MASAAAESREPLLRYERQPLLPPKVASRGYPHRYQSYHEPLQEEYIQSRQWFEIKTLWYLGRYGLPRGTSPDPDSTFIASLDWSAFLIVAMSLAATFICLRYGWKANEPLTLLGVVLVLPISFGMSFASERREVFLLDCASMKASVIGLWFVLRDWTESFKKAKRAYPDEFVSIADCTLEDITVYIEHRGGKERLYRVYQNLDMLSRMMDQVRSEEDWVRSMWSRGYQYQRLLMSDFERMRVLHDFRTPTAVRCLLFATNYLFPIFLAPLYANYSTKYGTWASVFTCMVTTFMVVSLLRIQFSVEDPFDEVGPDDINLGMIKECLKHISDSKAESAAKANSKAKEKDT